MKNVIMVLVLVLVLVMTCGCVCIRVTRVIAVKPMLKDKTINGWDYIPLRRVSMIYQYPKFNTHG